MRHLSEAVADLFENVVWVDLSSELHSVDLHRWEGVGSKLHPLLLVFSHYGVIVMLVIDLSVFNEGFFDTGLYLIFL